MCKDSDLLFAMLLNLTHCAEGSKKCFSFAVPSSTATFCNFTLDYKSVCLFFIWSISQIKTRQPLSRSQTFAGALNFLDKWNHFWLAKLFPFPSAAPNTCYCKHWPLATTAVHTEPVRCEPSSTVTGARWSLWSWKGTLPPPFVNPRFLISLPRMQDWQSSSLVALFGRCCLSCLTGRGSGEWRGGSLLIVFHFMSVNCQSEKSSLRWAALIYRTHIPSLELHKRLVCVLMGDRSKTAGNYWTRIANRHKSQWGVFRAAAFYSESHLFVSLSLPWKGLPVLLQLLFHNTVSTQQSQQCSMNL